MKEINCTIEGVTPLMLAKFTDEAAIQATSGRSTAARASSKGTPKEQAEKLLYYGVKGDLVILQPMIMSCIVEGGRFHKAGKKQITTKQESMLYACLEIEGTEVLLQSKEGWMVDTRPVRNPSTGGRFLAHRPMFNDWRLDFTMYLDDDILDVGLLRDIVDDAGKRIGMGAFRPSCKGPFGKFKVTHWEIKKEKKSKVA